MCKGCDLDLPVHDYYHYVAGQVLMLCEKTSVKSLSSWIKQLPDNISSRIDEILASQNLNSGRMYPALEDAIFKGFKWEETPEGWDYWMKLRAIAHNVPHASKERFSVLMNDENEFLRMIETVELNSKYEI